MSFFNKKKPEKLPELACFRKRIEPISNKKITLLKFIKTRKDVAIF
jgi:hypothetical protein